MMFDGHCRLILGQVQGLGVNTYDDEGTPVIEVNAGSLIDYALSIEEAEKLIRLLQLAVDTERRWSGV